jgi:membrane-associated phospholipid phosphatase
LNVALLTAYALLIVSAAVHPRDYLNIVRDWLPFAPVLLIYHEMGLLTLPQPTHSLEARWVVWDQVVLRGGAKALIELLGPFLPSLLEIAYLLVYAMGPISVAMLYVYGRRSRVDGFLFVFLLAVFISYAQFPFWPSEPPRILFAGQDLPTYATVFRTLNLWLLQVGGIRTSVFPSGHVAAASAAAAGMVLYLPEHKWIGRVLGVTAGLIAVATVYGRYHYLADAVAGLAMTGVALLIARLLGPGFDICEPEFLEPMQRRRRM